MRGGGLSFIFRVLQQIILLDNHIYFKVSQIAEGVEKKIVHTEKLIKAANRNQENLQVYLPNVIQGLTCLFSVN